MTTDVDIHQPSVKNSLDSQDSIEEVGGMSPGPMAAVPSGFPYPAYYPLPCNYPAFPYFYPPYGVPDATAALQSRLPNPHMFDYRFDPSAINFVNRPTQLFGGQAGIDALSKGASSDVCVAARVSKGRLRWTDEMDAMLKKAVELYGNSGVGMWKKVADFINAGVNYSFLDENGDPLDFVITNHQCGERYKHHIDPSLHAKKKGPWTDEEVDQLLELVDQHQSKAQGLTDHGRSKAQVNWLEVSARLNRNYRDCQHKYINISKSDLKNGPFTSDEEELIMQRVEELGEKSHGIWTKLEKELGRRSRSIQDKYARMSKKRKIS